MIVSSKRSEEKTDGPSSDELSGSEPVQQLAQKRKEPSQQVEEQPSLTKQARGRPSPTLTGKNGFVWKIKPSERVPKVHKGEYSSFPQIYLGDF